MPKIFGNRFGTASQADGYLSDKKSVYNLFDQYFSSRRGGWFSKVTASGGTEITTDEHKYHVFLSPGTLTVTVGGRIDYMIVGGGGNGGVTPPSLSGAAAGGGGGVNVGYNYLVLTSQPIVVGSAVNGSSFAGLPASAGSPVVSASFLFPSIGGPSGSPNPFTGGFSTGPAPTNPTAGGGGGGAGGAAGGVPGPTVGGAGGIGKAVPWAAAPIISPAIPAPIQPLWIPAVGSVGYYGGGGGGYGSTTNGTGGAGGGGSGSNGVTNTGGGGGGGGANRTGGSGIVIVRYRI
jgi:hypothetical protein